MDQQGAIPEKVAFVPAIEPLRAFAAISVLILHVIYISDWMAFPKAGPLGWFWVGWLGVDIFFVISGFVVTMAACREMASGNTAPRWSFFIRRFARVAPLYFLSMAVYLAVVNSAPVAGDDAWLQVLTHLFFVHNLFASTTGAINPPTWTIGTEMQLYLLLMLLMAWLGSIRPWRFAVAAIAVACAFRYVAYSINVGQPETFLSHITTQMPGMVDSFGLGIVLALLRQNGRLAQLSPPGWLILFVTAVAGLATCQMILSAHGASYWQLWWLPTFFRSFAAVACAALVWSAIAMPRHWQQAIPWGFVFLGRISYGIYLWHFIVILLLMRYADLGGLPFLASTLTITIAAAALSWRFIEKPSVKVAQKWLAARKH